MQLRADSGYAFQGGNMPLLMAQVIKSQWVMRVAPSTRPSIDTTGHRRGAQRILCQIKKK
jgi:hypothetical protein